MELHPRGSTGRVDVHLETVEEMQDFADFGLGSLSPAEIRASVHVRHDIKHNHVSSIVTLGESVLTRVGERLLDRADRYDGQANRNRCGTVAETCRRMGAQIVDYTQPNEAEQFLRHIETE